MLTTSTPATSLSCWVSDASTVATSTKLLSLTISMFPSSSVCVMVKEIGWSSSDAEQVNVAPGLGLDVGRTGDVRRRDAGLLLRQLRDLALGLGRVQDLAAEQQQRADGEPAEHEDGGDDGADDRSGALAAEPGGAARSRRGVP